MVDTTAPTVGAISFGGTGPYKVGDTITISVPITDDSDVALATGTGGAPTLTLVVGTTEKTLTSSTSAGTITALAFSYTVAAGDADADGVTVKANSLTLPSGTTVRDTAGNDLTTTFAAVNGGTTQTVDTAAPTVGTIAFTSTGSVYGEQYDYNFRADHRHLRCHLSRHWRFPDAHTRCRNDRKNIDNDHH